MIQIPSWLHSTFKELSNEYSPAQIRVKTKKLWPRQVGEEKQLLSGKYVATRKYVATSVATRKAVVTKQAVATSVATRKLCRDQKALSRPMTLQKLKKGRKVIF